VEGCYVYGLDNLDIYLNFCSDQFLLLNVCMVVCFVFDMITGPTSSLIPLPTILRLFYALNFVYVNVFFI